MKYRNSLLKTWKVVKISLMYLMLAFGVGSSFVGCSNKEPVPTPPVRIIDTVTIDKEVKAPREQISCDFKGIGIEPGQHLLDCLGKYIKAYNSVTVVPTKK